MFADSYPTTGAVFWGKILGRPLDQISALPVGVPGSTLFADIAAGDTSVCGVHSNGTVTCFGEDFSGSLGAGPAVDFAVEPVPVEGDSLYTSVASRFGTVCGLLEDGSLQCWVSRISRRRRWHRR